MAVKARPADSSALRPTPDLRVEHRGKARSRLVLGVFGNLQKAGSAMLALEERGFAPEDITLRLTKENRDVIEGRRVFRDQRGRTYVARVPIALRKVRRWSEGLALGAFIGALIGAAVSLFVGDAAVPYVVIFGYGFYARAVILWALVGIGAAFGGTVGAIFGAARLEYLAHNYAGVAALEGAIVGVAVNDDSEAEAVERDFASQGAEIVCAA